MRNTAHQYAVELYRADGRIIGQATVEPDWEPAREWTRFLALRKNLPGPGGFGRGTSIQPLWHRTEGEPYLRGFRVTVAGNGVPGIAEDFPLAYFRELASEATDQFVKSGQLREGETYRFAPLAYPREPESSVARALFTTDEVELPAEFKESPLEDFLRQSRLVGEQDPEDMPVFVPPALLEEVAEATLRAGGKETGGILLGHLHQDPDIPEVFLEVTAQIAAEYAEGSAARLSFTPATWDAVQAAVNLRQSHEIYAGYWHSHPVRAWCSEKGCTPERQEKCSLAAGFFSASDRLLLRTVFPRAYSLGLLATVPPVGELKFSLFGWWKGLIEPRGYYVLGVENET